MQARFLLGPAGSGKTFRCLAEIRTALAEAPDGPPLILLAPKQATFQLERQLLSTDEISGFTRLNIFSFERLARFHTQYTGQMMSILAGNFGLSFTDLIYKESPACHVQ